MKLIDALKREGVRVVNGNRWLVIEEGNRFVVREHKRGAHNSTTLCSTYDEEYAVGILNDG